MPPVGEASTASATGSPATEGPTVSASPAAAQQQQPRSAAAICRSVPTMAPPTMTSPTLMYWYIVGSIPNTTGCQMRPNTANRFQRTPRTTADSRGIAYPSSDWPTNEPTAVARIARYSGQSCCVRPPLNSSGKLTATGISRPIRPIQNGGASTLTCPAAKMRRGITMRMPDRIAPTKARPRPIQTSSLVSPPPKVVAGSTAQIAPPRKTKIPATCTAVTGSPSHTRAVKAAKIGFSDHKASTSVSGSHLAAMNTTPKSTHDSTPYMMQCPTATNSPVTRSRGTGTSPLRLSWNSVKLTRPMARMMVI
mmetsp:Transcript_37133/g.114682  ORF Transcript_37133/g.114682 Transcript_37133/m.114682 type:complete len:308 (-) Transcript_37133:840-1763(-)